MRVSRFLLWLLLVLPASGLASQAMGQTAAAGSSSTDWCQPSSEVNAELEKLGFDFAHVLQHASEQRPCGGATACWQRRIEAVAELLERYPADLFLHRAWQDLVRHGEAGPSSQDLQSKYRALVAEQPDQALFHHLLGRVEADRDASTRHQAEALRLDPGFVWSHLELAYRVFGDQGPGAAFDRLEQFMSRCPDRVGEPLMAAYMLGRSSSEAVSTERLQQLRRAVLNNAPWRQVRDLPVLWTLESRSAEPADQEAVRETIRADLRQLEQRQGKADYDSWMALRLGYQMTGDEGELQRVENELLEHFACAQPLVHLRLDRWRATAQQPTENALEAEQQAFAQETYSLAETWTELCPDELLFWRERFRAASELEELSPETLLAEGERLVEVTENTLGSYRFRRDSPHRQVAETLLKRGLYLERSAQILDRERELRDDLYGPPPQTAPVAVDGSGGSGPRPADYYRLGWHKHRLLAVGLATARGRLDESEAALQRVGSELAELATTFAESSNQSLLEATRAHYWQRRADLAVASGSRLDALAFYRKASFLEPANEVSQRRARELWSALGGGTEGFHQLTEIAAKEAMAKPDDEESSWASVARSLPEFRLIDLEGKAWTHEDLAGKAVLINLWATWCAPCLSEIPYLKHLASHLEAQQDMLLLTFNIDDNPGLVAPFAARHEITYPVLYAGDYVSDAVQSLSLPTSWILAPEGIVRYEQKGFEAGEDPEAWAQRIVLFLEQILGNEGG